jgi:hypothetical protein
MLFAAGNAITSSRNNLRKVHFQLKHPDSKSVTTLDLKQIERQIDTLIYDKHF